MKQLLIWTAVSALSLAGLSISYDGSPADRSSMVEIAMPNLSKVELKLSQYPFPHGLSVDVGCLCPARASRLRGFSLTNSGVVRAQMLWHSLNTTV